MFIVHGNFPVGIGHCTDDSDEVGIPPVLKGFRLEKLC